MNLSRPSEMVGFNDEKYSYKVFKKITGLSPEKYKKKGII